MLSCEMATKLNNANMDNPMTPRSSTERGCCEQIDTVVEFDEGGKMIALNDLVLLLSEVIIVTLGGLLVFVSSRAYRREKSRSMLAMSFGFGVIVVGSLIEEVFLEVLHYPLIEAHTFENLTVAIGFVILVYSIYGVRD